MRKEFLTNLRILLLEFNWIEHPSAQIYGLRFWGIFGISLSLYLLSWRAAEEKKGTLADQYTEYIQDGDDEDTTVGHMPWSSATVIITTGGGGIVEADEVAELDEEKREEEEILDKQLVEFGESTLTDVVPQVPGLLQDRVSCWKDDEGITVRHLSLSASSSSADATATGGGGRVEEEAEEGILDIQLVEFGEYVLSYIPLEDPGDGFLRDRVDTHGGSEKEQEEDGPKKAAMIETTGSATDMTTTMQLRRRRRHLWGMGTYEKKVRSFVESVLPSDSLLGLWGMRGVGKSELLGLVHDYYYHAGAGASSNFHHVVLVSAAACTAGLIVSRAQHAIATALGFDTSRSSTDQLDQIECRARIILNHLEDKDERVLLLLDDVEEPFNLFHLGLPIIPSLKVVHKIIYATRSQSVCAQMQMKHFEGALDQTTQSADYNTIQMRCLGQDDARNLFQENVGLEMIKDAHPQIHRLAKEIMVEECRGLPLALRVIGRAMSSKRDVREWRNAYNLLKDKHSMTQEDQGYSYLDILETQLKESFLVTSLWPQDGSIPKEMRSLEIPATRPDPKRRRRRLRWIMYLTVLFCQLMLSLLASTRFASLNRFNHPLHFLFLLVQFQLNFNTPSILVRKKSYQRYTTSYKKGETERSSAGSAAEAAACPPMFEDRSGHSILNYSLRKPGNMCVDASQKELSYIYKKKRESSLKKKPRD